MRNGLVRRFAVLSVLVSAAAVASGAYAQGRAVGQKPGDGVKAIDRQAQGNYPRFDRSELPLGAINETWSSSAECGEEATTVLVAHSPTKEIRIRLRQLLGTVIAFPQKVSLVQKPGGKAFTARPHGGGEGDAGATWILGATSAGIDGNMVFVSDGSEGMPTLYVLHVQAEGFNTKNCPDLLVLVQPPTARGITALAQSIQQWSDSIRNMRSSETVDPLEGSGNSARERPVDTSKASLDGRGETDWVEGKPFDPSKLDFDWRVYGEESLAPDIVYSDGVFTYLKFSTDRLERVRIAAISSVEKTSRGAVDTPINWNLKNNTIVIQGVQRLTLEREGLVLCIVPGNLPAPKLALSGGAAHPPDNSASSGDY